MTDETIRAKLSGIRCFLLDMDGTFYLGDRIIPGGLEFLDALEKTGRTARFLTNNSPAAPPRRMPKSWRGWAFRRRIAT